MNPNGADIVGNSNIKSSHLAQDICTETGDKPLHINIWENHSDCLQSFLTT